MKRKTSTYCVHSAGWASCCLLMIISGSLARAGEIVLRPQVQPRDSVVRLGNVAEIRGLDDATTARLAAMPLLPAPAAGTQRFLRQREVLDMLVAHGEDVSGLRFSGTAQVAIQPRVTSSEASQPAIPVVERVDTPAAAAGTTLPRDNKSDRRTALLKGRVSGSDVIDGNSAATPTDELVRSALINYLASRGGTVDDWQATFSLGDRQRAALALARPPITCDGGIAPWTGKQRFVLSLDTADGPVNLQLMADVARSQPVVVTLHAIERSALFTAADLDVQTVDNAVSSTSRRAPFASVNDIVGMEAGRAIQAGEIVYSDQVAAPLLVHRGETITVVAQGGGIRVRTSALARQDGTRGELVQVESQDTKQRYDARVIGRKEASVLAPARPSESPAETVADARTADVRREVPAFRRYRQQIPAPPQANLLRERTASRNSTQQNGNDHDEAR